MWREPGTKHTQHGGTVTQKAIYHLQLSAWTHTHTHTISNAWSNRHFKNEPQHTHTRSKHPIRELGKPKQYQRTNKEKLKTRHQETQKKTKKQKRKQRNKKEKKDTAIKMAAAPTSAKWQVAFSGMPF